MTTHVLDIPLFRAQFPAFADPTKYPDAYLQIAWDTAIIWITPDDFCRLNGTRLQLAINLMTAHIILTNQSLLRGTGKVGPVTSSTIDKITVAILAPPAKNAWQQWLSTTPYGLQFWALLTAAAAGGVTVGGRPERSGFRKIGGFF